MLLLGRVSALLSVVVSVVWWLVLVCACAYQQEFDNKTYLEDIPKISCWIFCMVFFAVLGAGRVRCRSFCELRDALASGSSRALKEFGWG